MTAPQDVLAQIFQASGGEIVGRIRLQKIAYLLQQKGKGSDLFFTYYHYGPYSRELAASLDRGVAFDEIEERELETGYGTTYSAFRWKKRVRKPADSVGTLSMTEARACVDMLKKQSSVILELAATIHWLACKEEVGDWRNELKARKALKATDQNIKRARRVLHDMGLAMSA